MEQPLDQMTAKPSRQYVLRAVGYFAVLIMVNILSYRVISQGLQLVAPRWFSLLVADIAYWAGVLALTWAFCHYLDRSSLGDLGLKRARWFGNLAAGWGLGVFLQLLIFLALLLAGWLTVEQARPQAGPLAASILSWTLISFNEELSFRGYIMQRLSQAWGMPAAVIVSSLVFASVHMLNPNVRPLAFVGLFAAGILLACAYLVTRSLWLPIGLHIGWNLAEIHLFGFAGSGFTEPGLMQTIVHGPEIITGGAFGPEGGLSGLVAPLVGIIILYVGYRIVLARKTHN